MYTVYVNILYDGFVIQFNNVSSGSLVLQFPTKLEIFTILEKIYAIYAVRSKNHLYARI